jgi:hypothetical protein
LMSIVKAAALDAPGRGDAEHPSVPARQVV